MLHFTTSAGKAQPYVIPVMLSTGATAWDTTASKTLDISWTWATASASNSIQCDDGGIDIT
jgi:hypothetical protein